MDVEALRSSFARSGAVVISPFLPDEEAERLRMHLLGRADWRGRFRTPDGRLFEPSAEEMTDWGPGKIAAIRSLVAPRLHQKGFGYAHTRLRIIDPEGEQVEGPGVLADFGNFLKSETALELIRAITGEHQINFADSFAARYDPGDYTTSHDDGIGTRKAAYVFGLTKQWRSDWGGLLLFHGENGQVESGLIPGFNILTLFAVPRMHSVSVVAPFATEPRFTVTGWFCAVNDLGVGA
jgi:SM-20-related protein